MKICNECELKKCDCYSCDLNSNCEERTGGGLCEEMLELSESEDLTNTPCHNMCGDKPYNIYLFHIDSCEEEGYYLIMTHKEYWDSEQCQFDGHYSGNPFIDSLCHKLNIWEETETTFSMEDNNPDVVRAELLKTGRFKEDVNFSAFFKSRGGC